MTMRGDCRPEFKQANDGVYAVSGHDRRAQLDPHWHRSFHARDVGQSVQLPAVVRFSYADNTPGLNIRMKAPSTFALSIVPKTAQVSEGGRVAVRTADEMFDARFVTRTDQPTQAKMFLSGKQTLAQLQKLCCSSKTFLTMSNGNMELSELVIPSPYTDRHISDHLDSLLRVAAALGQMPGADAQDGL